MTKIEEIKKLIEETFSDIKVEYIFDDKNTFCQGFFKHPNGVFVFSIKKDSKCINIKRSIEEFISQKLFQNGFPECLICYEEITTQAGYCSVCSFIYCYECFLKIFNENRGLVICPKCRYTIDKREEFNKAEQRFLNSINPSLLVANMLCYPQ